MPPESIDPASPVPLYHQIAESIRSRIAAGSLESGDALEPMRQAAERWGVNLHTVRHAYAALARDGLVETSRGARGTRVIAPPRSVRAPTEGDLEYSTVHDESFKHDDHFGPVVCPRCGETPMGKVEFNIHTGIILDYCRHCRGFWLDGPELERVNREVRKLNEPGRDARGPAIQWLAEFLFGLPR